MRAREYTPATGSSLSNDPWDKAGGDANIRRYAVNDPNNLTGSQRPLAPSSLGFPAGWASAGQLALPSTITATCSLRGFWRRLRAGSTSIPLRAGTRRRAIRSSTAARSAEGSSGPRRTMPWTARDTAGSERRCRLNRPWLSVNHYTNSKVGNLNDLLNALNGGHGNGGSGAGGGGGGCGGSGSSSGNGGGGGGGAGGSSGNATSHDPNALVGPGYGTKGFIKPSGNWSYTADFENDGSVAAQTSPSTSNSPRASTGPPSSSDRSASVRSISSFLPPD